FNRFDPSLAGVLALGLMPFFSAFSLVELAALIVPRWRPLRHGGPPGRARLHTAAITLTLLLALVQALFMVKYLRALGAIEYGSWGLLPGLSLVAGAVGLGGLS